MKRQPWISEGATWDDRLHPSTVKMARPLRLWLQKWKFSLMEVEVQGLEHVKPLLKEGAGVLMTPNHPSDPDAFVMYEVADRLTGCFHFMAANHMFAKRNPLERWVLRLHGCFSVDREGTDLRAFRHAVKLLQDSPNPLVIFPEGEVYHLNDRVTPFRDGPAAIALSAARRTRRPIYCIPCAIKYEYIEDPTSSLESVMTELEMRINWRPQTTMSLAERIYKYAEGQMALKELEYLGIPQQGTLPGRLTHLREHILTGLESRYELKGEGHTVPERVKALRRVCLMRLQEGKPSTEARKQMEIDLDDVLLVVQLFSYPGDYVRQTPTIERIAETLDKLEEDVLQLSCTRIRAPRSARVALDEPLEVSRSGHVSARHGAPALADELEDRVQKLIDQLAQP
jgi:hypothetical protein